MEAAELELLFPFQSTPLMRGETRLKIIQARKKLFQSTPLMRGETMEAAELELLFPFQSTPLMRGETWHVRIDQRI